MVKVAVVQGGPGIPGDNMATNKTLEILVRRAVDEHGAEFVQLPELATTPYFAGRDDIEYQSMAESIDGPTVQFFRQLAAELRIHIVLPFFERDDEGLFNSACLIDDAGELIPGVTRDGREVLTFRKIHLPASYDELTGEIRSDEKRCFLPGQETPIFTTRFGKVGILICWDKRFTELWRTYMLLGAEMICNPICTWGAWRDDTYPAEVRVMALYNQAFVLGGSKSGEDPYHAGRLFTGGSHIASPNGLLLATLGASIDGIVSAEIDLAEVAVARRTTPILRDRRPEMYSEIVRTGD